MLALTPSEPEEDEWHVHIRDDASVDSDVFEVASDKSEDVGAIVHPANDSVDSTARAWARERMALVQLDQPLTPKAASEGRDAAKISVETPGTGVATETPGSELGAGVHPMAGTPELKATPRLEKRGTVSQLVGHYEELHHCRTEESLGASRTPLGVSNNTLLATDEADRGDEAHNTETKVEIVSAKAIAMRWLLEQSVQINTALEDLDTTSTQHHGIYPNTTTHDGSVSNVSIPVCLHSTTPSPTRRSFTWKSRSQTSRGAQARTSTP